MQATDVYPDERKAYVSVCDVKNTELTPQEVRLRVRYF